MQLHVLRGCWACMRVTGTMGTFRVLPILVNAGELDALR